MKRMLLRRVAPVMAALIGFVSVSATSAAALDDPPVVEETDPYSDSGTPEDLAAAVASGLKGYSCGPNDGKGLNPYTRVPKDERFREDWGRYPEPGLTDLTVSLYRSYQIEYNGARIWWVWGSNLRPGDKVSLDWSDDSGRSWWACHATVKSPYTSVTTPAVDKAGRRVFRACLKPYNRPWACTRRWLPA